MMNKKSFLLILATILTVLNIYAQNPLSLSDAISIGLKNNYEVRIERKNEEVAQINNTWGNTGIMPSINFNANAREDYNFNDTEDYRTQSISPELSLNWVFFNGFSARISKKQYEELEKQSEGNTVVLIETTIQDIILAYNNCILQKEMTEVFNKLADLSKDRYDRAKDSEALGTGTTYESLQAKTSWLEDQSNFLQQKLNYENAVRSLNYVIAVEDEMVWDLITPLETEAVDYNIDELKSRLLSGNQTLKNQYIYQSILAKKTSQAKSSQYPSLSLSTGLGNTMMDQYYSGNTPDIGQDYSNAYIGINLSFNIFNGGIKKRSVQIAKISEEVAGIQTSQIKHSLSNQLLQIYSNYDVQREILKLADEKMAAASLNLDLSSERFKNGSINSFNYRDVQNSYMNAAITKYNAVYNLISSNTELLRITGGIISEYE